MLNRSVFIKYLKENTGLVNIFRFANINRPTFLLLQPELDHMCTIKYNTLKYICRIPEIKLGLV